MFAVEEIFPRVVLILWDLGGDVGNRYTVLRG